MQQPTLDVHLLDVHLLGGFRIALNGETLTTLSQSRQQSLLAYLILHAGTPQARQQVAFSLWPESTEERAYANLRYTLHTLRRSCVELDRFLESGQSTLQWRRPAPFRLDVTDYETLIAQANESPDASEACKLLIQAINLYRGDLLPTCYDDWIRPIRERLSLTHNQTLQHLVDQLDIQEQHQVAINYAVQLISHDPFRELSYRRLMELHDAVGDRAAAVRVYHNCRTVLELELGVEPAPETRALYERLVMPSEPQIIVLQPPTPVTSTVSSQKFIGRHEELILVQKAWQTAKQGRPYLALIRGEAGMGKTRLAEEVLTRTQQQGYLTVRTRAYAAEGQLAYSPVVGWLRSERYREPLRRLDNVWLVELARILPELLSEFPDLPMPLPLSDNWQRQRFFEALAYAVVSVGLPLLVLIDDLQWADQETLEWLPFLLRFNPSAALLLIGTARIDEVDSRHPLTVLLLHLRHSLQISEIELAPLDVGTSAELAQQVAGRHLDAGILDTLYRYSEGVPLFVVESIRAGVDQDKVGTWRWHDNRSGLRLPAAPLPIPPRIYAVLQARLNQLSPQARRLVDLAAVIGRSFAFDLLQEASGAGEAEVVQGLDELWKRRIICEQGADYEISHDRIRDVAYAELSPVQCRSLHRRVAQTLERLYAADLERVSTRLAWHYELAGLPKQAVDYYLMAGVAAHRVYANNQAIDLFAKGLALLEQLPESAQRDRQELSLQMAIAAAIRAKSIIAPEVTRAINRAVELSRKIDDTAGHFWPLYGLNQYHVMLGETRQCKELSQSLLSIAEREEEPSYLLVAHIMTGVAHYLSAEFVASSSYFARASSLYTTKLHGELVMAIGFDFGLLTHAFWSHTLWCLGYADQALEKCQQVLELAQQLAHPYSQVMILAYVAMLHQFRREREATQAQAETALALAIRHEATYYGAWVALLAQWALASARPEQEKIAALRQAIDDFRATGAAIRLPYYLSLLAELYRETGRFAEAVVLLEEALYIANDHGEHWWDAELHRMRGLLLLAQGADTQQVEAAYQHALAIAQQQQARILELRAAMSLARLWQQSRPGEAHTLLLTCYRGFSEGFDTLDLQEAKELLAQLA